MSELPCATLTKTHYEEKEEVMRIFVVVVAFFKIGSRSPNAQCMKTEVCVLRIPPRASLEKHFPVNIRVTELRRAADTTSRLQTGMLPSKNAATQLHILEGVFLSRRVYTFIQ